MRVTSQTEDAVSPETESAREELGGAAGERGAGGPWATAGGVVVGELVAIADDGRSPLVIHPGQHGSAAVRARTIVDLHGAHVGRNVALVFEAGDATLPIVIGVLRESAGWPLEQKPPQVEMELDGERLVVTAVDRLVLRCGKASITLTKAGKVLIEGRYILSKSSGVNRVKGGSVHLN